MMAVGTVEASMVMAEMVVARQVQLRRQVSHRMLRLLR